MRPIVKFAQRLVPATNAVTYLVRKYSYKSASTSITPHTFLRKLSSLTEARMSAANSSNDVKNLTERAEISVFISVDILQMIFLHIKQENICLKK